VRCARCGHPYRSHDLGSEHRCRTRIAYDWDEKKKTFLKTAPCRCFGFKGEQTKRSGCPHEYVSTAEACVVCGHVPARWEKQI
jgi:hypothetical protein